MDEIALDTARAGPQWVVLAVVAVVLLVLGALMVLRSSRHERRRTAVLQAVFGSEYAHVVAGRGGRAAAEKELVTRLRRCGEVALRDLDMRETEQIEAAWYATAVLFVESPAAALHEADVLVDEVMRERGYPVERFGDRVGLVSLDHPELAGHLRTAHRMAVLADQGGISDTEPMRLALVAYRRVLDALLAHEDAPRVGG